MSQVCLCRKMFIDLLNNLSEKKCGKIKLLPSIKLKYLCKSFYFYDYYPLFNLYYICAITLHIEFYSWLLYCKSKYIIKSSNHIITTNTHRHKNSDKELYRFYFILFF